MTNKEVVQAFIDAWNRVDWDAVSALMTEDVAYQNMPWAPVAGRDAVMANLAGFDVQASDWITHNIVADGDLVMTERTDRVQMRGIWKSLRAMGVFRLRDGRISEWRDYFDPAELTADIAPPERGVL
ncbi:limonene-1,2-epoxide hydrolase family protein [Sphingomonas profundi]|uniref:limonene-1,2-epoxide hydrolase family protein n=1 Tax=Alterirhizorhabdus profundi TaxID=2681549 RepID=UPI0018D1F65E|nr:limonene-1,2-epoxide hydrolase family protein [Sphingomonas profundi]